MSRSSDGEFTSAAEFAGMEIPERRWAVPGYIPDRTVTLLSGDGGTGKSILALQLGVAVAIETDWLGLRPTGGSAIVLSAEDDRQEIHRRLADICEARAVRFECLGNLHIWNLANREAILARHDRQAGTMAPTPLWQELKRKVANIRPNLVIIDPLADVFGGDEINRAQTRAFLAMLRGLALEFELAVLLTAHPSVAGLSSGSGTSGSTAWSNSVRSRLYLERVKPNSVGEADHNSRVLTTKKANYAGIGAEIRLRWHAGVFHRQDEHAEAGRAAAKEASAEAIFLELLTLFDAQGREVSTKPSNNFAPAVFAKHPNARGFTKDALRPAMERLLEKGTIGVVTVGPPSKRRNRLAFRQAGTGQQEAAAEANGPFQRHIDA